MHIVSVFMLEETDQEMEVQQHSKRSIIQASLIRALSSKFNNIATVSKVHLLSGKVAPS
jgi:hypothetical protein